jgi:glycosyltransferase involved in cell wall biosynthesis
MGNNTLATRIVILTDTYDQVNGVSRTYKSIEALAPDRFIIIHPSLFKWIPMPFYSESQLCIQPWKVWNFLKKIQPCQLHLATEGVLGWVGKAYCKFNGIPYTSAYHSKFPDLLYQLLFMPKCITRFALKLFHGKSTVVLVPTESVRNELLSEGYSSPMQVWTRGVDETLLSSNPNSQLRPSKLRLLSVGRISKEKNLEELCELSSDYEITIVGDGPHLYNLKSTYPQVNFLGYRFGKDLAELYKSHDVFVFTSRNDTFGIVLIEALANGLPVAAHDVTGPKDIIINGFNGILGESIRESVEMAALLNRDQIQSQARSTWSWMEALRIMEMTLKQNYSEVANARNRLG